MRPAIRENALCALMAGAGCAAMAWLGLYGFAWNDYDQEARPAVEALVHGHLGAFARLAPAYGGSLVERAPFALLAHGLGGDQLAVYRMLALPCLLASAVLGVWLVARMRAGGQSLLARAVALGLCVANPVTLRALELGHPEELLGGCLCVAAVLLAARERPLAAGLVLGLAIANKPWALIAFGPALLCLAPGRARALCLLSAGATTAAILAPLLLASHSALAAGTRAGATGASAIFEPWQAWWFVGHHGQHVVGLFGSPKPGYRAAPLWLATFSHAVVLAAGLGTALLLRLSRRRLGEREALLALALILLLRCLLDTWDTVYYALPFLLALLAWEVAAHPRRPPLLALSCTVLVWISFESLPAHLSADAQAAFFLLWSLALAGWLALGLRRPGLGAPAPPPADRPRGAGAQVSTVSSLGRLVRTS